MLGLHRESLRWQASVERFGLEACGCQDLDLVQYIAGVLAGFAKF